MSFTSWVSGVFTDRGKAMSHYKRGMGKAKKHDHEGAVHEYTLAIEMPDIPGDIKAMSLYNRALTYVAADKETEGIADLQAVLAMHEEHTNIKSMARQKLLRMDNRANR